MDVNCPTAQYLVDDIKFNPTILIGVLFADPAQVPALIRYPDAWDAFAIIINHADAPSSEIAQRFPLLTWKR